MYIDTPTSESANLFNYKEKINKKKTLKFLTIFTIASLVVLGTTSFFVLLT